MIKDFQTHPYSPLELVQAEYIALLEKGLKEVSGLAYVHGYRVSKEDIKEGERLRKLINKYIK